MMRLSQTPEQRWDEGEHPRDEYGQFTDAGGGTDDGQFLPPTPIPEHLQHLDAFDKGSTYKTHERDVELTRQQIRDLKNDIKSAEKFAKAQKIDLDIGYAYANADEFTSSIEVKWIENKSGEKGRARQVMQRLNDLADKWDLQLYGRPRLGELKLIDYYKQFGWKISPEQEEAAKLGLYYNPDSTVLGASPFMWRDPKQSAKKNNKSDLILAANRLGIAPNKVNFSHKLEWINVDGKLALNQARQDPYSGRVTVFLNAIDGDAVDVLQRCLNGAIGGAVLKQIDQTNTLYVHRPLLNADEIVQWAKAQGFTTTLPAEDMHVTIAFSKSKVDWSKLVAKRNIITVDGGKREVKRLGEKGEAVVLAFSSSELSSRWKEFIDEGASWDFPSYQPHVTITWHGADIDLAEIRPYDGPLKFGPEIFAELDEDWKDNVVERAFDESEHPRDEHGKFTDAGGSDDDEPQPPLSVPKVELHGTATPDFAGQMNRVLTNMPSKLLEAASVKTFRAFGNYREAQSSDVGPHSIAFYHPLYQTVGLIQNQMAATGLKAQAQTMRHELMHAVDYRTATTGSRTDNYARAFKKDLKAMTKTQKDFYYSYLTPSEAFAEIGAQLTGNDRYPGITKVFPETTKIIRAKLEKLGIL